MTKEILIFYTASVLAAFGSDIALTVRVNEILKERKEPQMSYIMTLEDILAYFIPIYNLYCFATYSFGLFFVPDDDLIESLLNGRKEDDDE